MKPGPPIESAASRWRSRLSLAALGLSTVLLAATWFLISPRSDVTYPGAIPWGAHSLLRPLVDGMGGWGLLQSERGVEAKDLALHLAAAGRVVATVHDAAGRAVAQPLDAFLAAGDHPLTWDGRDGDGRELPRGVYFVRVVTADGVGTTRVVLAR